MSDTIDLYDPTMPPRAGYCPYPLMDDGYPHAVVEGICETCGAQIVPARRPEIGPGLWREPHYRCLPKPAQIGPSG
jgi:hypothetical protein